MLATIEAYYDNGKITTTENIGIKSGRVLLTKKIGTVSTLNPH